MRTDHVLFLGLFTFFSALNPRARNATGARKREQEDQKGEKFAKDVELAMNNAHGGGYEVASEKCKTAVSPLAF
jgi:hypothetical protein